jgi:hypothetical protein
MQLLTKIRVRIGAAVAAVVLALIGGGHFLSPTNWESTKQTIGIVFNEIAGTINSLIVRLFYTFEVNRLLFLGLILALFTLLYNKYKNSLGSPSGSTQRYSVDFRGLRLQIVEGTNQLPQVINSSLESGICARCGSKFIGTDQTIKQPGPLSNWQRTYGDTHRFLVCENFHYCGGKHVSSFDIENAERLQKSPMIYREIEHESPRALYQTVIDDYLREPMLRKLDNEYPLRPGSEN